jgi:hypothetical protein
MFGLIRGRERLPVSFSRSPSLNTKQPHLFSSAAGEVPTRLGNIQFAGAFGLEHQLELKHE